MSWFKRKKKHHHHSTEPFHHEIQHGKWKKLRQRITLSRLFSFVTGVAITVIIIMMCLYACTNVFKNNSNKIPLQTIVDTRQRYKYIHEPSDADIIGDIDRKNNLDFTGDDLTVTHNENQSVRVTCNQPKYSGWVDIHYDISSVIHLDEWVTTTYLGALREQPTSSDIIIYIETQNLDQHTREEWDSFERNVSCQLHSNDDWAMVIPLQTQTTTTPFVGTLYVTYSIE